MPKYAYERLRAGQPMPGVIVIPEDLAVGKAIEELVTLVECCEPEELSNQVKYLPFTNSWLVALGSCVFTSRIPQSAIRHLRFLYLSAGS